MRRVQAAGPPTDVGGAHQVSSVSTSNPGRVVNDPGRVVRVGLLIRRDSHVVRRRGAVRGARRFEQLSYTWRKQAAYVVESPFVGASRANLAFPRAAMRRPRIPHEAPARSAVGNGTRRTCREKDCSASLGVRIRAWDPSGSSATPTKSDPQNCAGWIVEDGELLTVTRSPTAGHSRLRLCKAGRLCTMG